MKTTKFIFTIMLTVAVLTACNKNDKEKFSPLMLPDGAISIIGANPGGNIACEEVGSYLNSSGRIDYTGGTGPWTVGPITWSTDGTYITWTSSVPVQIAVIVKGGPNASVYKYNDDCITGGTELTAPINPNNGKPYGLSNITFCYNECELPPPFVIAVKSMMTTRYVTSGKFISYYPLIIGGSYPLYYEGIVSEDRIVGYLSVTDNDSDSHLEITIDNSLNSDLLFTKTYIYVGTEEDFNLDYQNYTYTINHPVPVDTWTSELP